MIRCAVPKGRLASVVRQAFETTGIEWQEETHEAKDRGLRLRSRDGSLELLWLKDRDLPVYVERGVAHCGIVGRDVVEEVDGELLIPAEFRAGQCRFCLIAPREMPPPSPGQQVRLATKYPRLAARWLEQKPFAAEIVELSGSVELAPVLGLSDYALDIVETGATLRAHQLVELETVLEVRPCFVVHRAAWQLLREELLGWIKRFESAGVLA